MMAFRVEAYYRQVTWCFLLVCCLYGGDDDVALRVVSGVVFVAYVVCTVVGYYRVVMSNESEYTATVDDDVTLSWCVSMLQSKWEWTDRVGTRSPYYVRRYRGVFGNFTSSSKWFGTVDGIVVPLCFAVLGSITSQSTTHCNVNAAIHTLIVFIRLVLVVRLRPYITPLYNCGAVLSNI